MTNENKLTNARKYPGLTCGEVGVHRHSETALCVADSEAEIVGFTTA